MTDRTGGANDPEPRVPWYVDEEKAEVLSPDIGTTDITQKVRNRYKDIYYSTPYHKEWDHLPSEMLFRVWPPNSTLAVEKLSLFFQAVMGPPSMLNEAATRFLNTLTWSNNPENEQLAGIALALDHILASNGGSAGTITIARTETGYPEARDPVYVRFQKGVAETSVDVPRYPDGERVEEREHTLDLGLLRSARSIQEEAASPPVEVELALESYGSFGGGELGIGLEIRDETSVDDLYRRQNSDSNLEVLDMSEQSEDTNGGVISRLKRATEGILWADIDYAELPKADNPCPNCNQDTLHVENGRLSNVYRCSNCRSEGAGP